MEMKISKFWYVACTVFCLYNLNTLVSERYEVAILAENGNESEPTISLVCQELSVFHLNETKYELSQLRADLYGHFNALMQIKAKDKRWRRRYQKDFERLILNQIETGNHLIYNDRLCFIFKGRKYPIDQFLLRPEFFENSTGDFVKMDDTFDQVIVVKKGPPYSNCRKSNSRFRCLNDCFKRRFRLSRYFYECNETGLIHLSPSMNQTIEEWEKSRFAECPEENCKLVQLIPFSFSEDREPKFSAFKAQPKLSEFEFWVPFIGLVCSFANISLNQFASMMIKFASLRVKRRRMKIALFYLKWAIFLISLAYCGYLYTTMALEHKAKEQDPDQKEIMRNQIKQEVIRLVICINITKYFTEGSLDFKKLNKTMLEIEKATDKALDEHLEGINVNYQNRMFRVDHTTHPKVLFSFSYYYSKGYKTLLFSRRWLKKIESPLYVLLNPRKKIPRKPRRF